MPEKLFDDEFVSTLEYLAVLAKRVFAKQRQLRERMRKLGSGQEFADHRAYSPGDDFRYLDWNLYGRLGKLLLRVFEEEEDLRVTFLLDSSDSMKIETKFDAARRLVAALAYVALSRFDEVAIAPFAERPGTPLSPRKGKGSITGILNYLENLTAGGMTDPLAAARKLALPQQRRGLAVFASDLCEPDAALDTVKFLRHHRFDVFVLHVFAQAEARPDAVGDLRITNVETSESLTTSADEKTLDAYEASFQEHLMSLEASCIRAGAHYLPAPSDMPFIDIVRDVLEKGILAA
ncbi:MAG: DUF58 domain-containing protein [Planctomycetota bacterium]|nr:MAG: DUF58 domain-containing protein [Planctomycetota bacterium]